VDLASYREGYDDGFVAGFAQAEIGRGGRRAPRRPEDVERFLSPRGNPHPKKRKLSAWNKFVKANSKKPRFVYRNGKLNLKKMGVAFRKTPAGKKKK